jgi:hypothetical protein
MHGGAAAACYTGFSNFVFAFSCSKPTWTWQISFSFFRNYVDILTWFRCKTLFGGQVAFSGIVI